MQLELAKAVVEAFEQWKTVPAQELKFQRLTGITNQTFLCSQNRVLPQKIIVRKFDKKCEGLFINRLVQDKVYLLTHQHKIGPQIYVDKGSFRCEEFIESQVLSTQDMTKEDVLKRIAYSVARFHSMEADIDRSSMLLNFVTSKKYLPAFQKAQQTELFTEEEAKLIAEMKGLLTEEEGKFLIQVLNSQTQELVLSHNDLLANNVLIRGDGRLCLIDFEYASYNLRGYDLANYLVQSSYDYSVYEPPYFRRGAPASEESRRLLLGYYCHFVVNKCSWEEVLKLQKLPELGEKEAKLRVAVQGQMRACELFCNYYWLVWAIHMSKDPSINMDYVRHAYTRLQNYHTAKAGLLSR